MHWDVTLYSAHLEILDWNNVLREILHFISRNMSERAARVVCVCPRALVSCAFTDVIFQSIHQ
jgi:hypothetical protein